MASDPATERARSVVMLVIATVAVPSLLLTALGAVAVENEEAAARKRIEKLYDPVNWEVARRFNAKMDQLLADGNEPFEEMVRLAQEEHADLEKIERFVQSTGDVAINYFVIDPGGEVLLPRAPDDEPAKEGLSQAMQRALQYELEHRGGKSTCAKWTQVGDGCEDERCAAEVARSMCRLSTGRQDAYQFTSHCSEYVEAPVVKEALRMAALEHECTDEMTEHARKLARVSKEPIQIQPTPLSKAASERLIEGARQLARVAKDPTKLQPPLSTKLVAQRLIARLEHQKGAAAECSLEMMRALSERGPMLEQLSNLSHPRDTPPQIETFEANDWRRVLVARSIDGYYVGFELVACALEPYLDAQLAEKQLEDAVHVDLSTIQSPKSWWEKTDWHEEGDGNVGAWVLLKKTHLAWKQSLVLEDQVGLLSVTRSRSTLYFWALILTGCALIAGIVYTVRTVSYEARLARLKTDFVSSVSHDLRTPLTSIRMFTETLLLGRASSKEEEREFLQVIADETDRLSRLTERILDFSRMEAGKKAYQFAPAEVPELVGHALRACRPMIEEAGFTVKPEHADDLPTIQVDRDAMVEVLINLISNAIKYSPDERCMGIRALVEGERIGISVSDRGIGIAKAEHGKIFDKFYRVDSRRACEVGGTGLGLSLVRHIVTAHGGEVTVVSAPGEGSTFTVWLPAPKAASEPSLEVRTWRASSS